MALQRQLVLIRAYHLSISKDEESATSLGTLYQDLVILMVKKGFLMLRENPLCFPLCSLPLVLCLSTIGKNLAAFCTFPSVID